MGLVSVKVTITKAECLQMPGCLHKLFIYLPAAVCAAPQLHHSYVSTPGNHPPQESADLHLYPAVAGLPQPPAAIVWLMAGHEQQLQGQAPAK